MSKPFDKLTPEELAIQVAKTEAFLLKHYGIKNRKEFEEAYRNMKPLNISCFVSKPKSLQVQDNNEVQA